MFPPRLGSLAASLLFLFVLCLAAPAAAQKPPLPAWVKGDTFEAKSAPRETTLTGYTRPRYVMDLVGEEEGRCQKVLADVGQELGKDGVYAQLDTTFIDLEIRKNQAEQKRIRANLDFIAKEVARYRTLVQKDLSDQSNLDRLSSSKEQNEFELESLRIEEARLRERRARFAVRGKPGWRLISRGLQPGEWVKSGVSLGQAGDFSTLLVPFALSSEEYASLKAAKELSLRFPDVAGSPRVAVRLERVSPDFDPETRKINVDLAFGAGLPEMRGGLKAELSLSLPDPAGVVLVPQASVLERYEEFWLSRPGGENVKVFVLGSGPDNTYRVRGEGVRPGGTFLVAPGL